MNIDRLIGEITAIPHLDLGLRFDQLQMVQDYMHICKDPQVIQPYRTSTPRIATKIANAWQGVSLFSPDGSLHSDLTENPSDHAMSGLPTPIVDKAPYMVSILEELGGYDREKNVGTRARIMTVQPKSSLTWHSHQFDVEGGVEKFRPWMIIVHIPFIVPSEFRYSVIPIQDFRLRDHENEKMRIYSQNYAPGHATLFNSIHYHNVFNDSEVVPRISLMVHLDLRNPITFKIVDEALAHYEGEYIDVSD